MSKHNYIYWQYIKPLLHYAPLHVSAMDVGHRQVVHEDLSSIVIHTCHGQ